MVPVRTTIELSEGVKVEMLFTPHLFSYKGRCGITFEAEAADARQMAEYFADMLYCAALNSWEIDRGGDPDDFPCRRGDFHGLIVGAPDDFRRVIDFALRALTGKNGRELTEAQAVKAGAPEVKKKLFLHLIGKR